MAKVIVAFLIESYPLMRNNDNTQLFSNEMFSWRVPQASTSTTNAVAVFVLLDILHPVQTILNAPMTSDHLAKRLGTIATATADIVRRLDRRNVVRLRLPAESLHSDDPTKTRPRPINRQRITLARCIPQADNPAFDSTMTVIRLLIAIHDRTRGSDRLALPKQRGLIPLDRHQVVISGINDRFYRFF